MTSDSSAPQGDLAALKSDIEQDAASLSPKNEVDNLRERLDTVELLIEEFSQAREMQSSISDYVSDLKGELADLKKLRLWVTIASGLMSISLFGVILYCVVYAPTWFIGLDASAKVPFLIACGGGSVFLMSTLLRGVYRSRSDRNKDEILPEHLKQVRDAISKSE